MPSVTYRDYQEPTVNAQWLNNVNASAFAFVNVKQPDFGAIGDGVADDTQSILAAVAYVMAQPNGGTVYFPQGTYNMSGGCAVLFQTDQGLKLQGDGHATKIRYTGPNSGVSLFSLGGGAPVFGANLWVEGMGFINATTNRADAFNLQNINSSLFDNVNIYNARNGIILNNSFNTRIVDSYIYGCSATGITTSVTGTNSLIVRDSVIQQCPTGVNLLIGGNNIVIEGNDFEGNGIDIGITNYTSVRIAGNYCELETNARFFFGGTNQMVDIEQNWLGQSAVTTNLGNVISGNFRKNTIYQSTWTTSNGTGSDFIVGQNTLLTGAVLANSAWVTPALSNGFTQQANYYPVQYIKNEDNVVTIRGNTQNGANNVLAFNIPAGYRPKMAQTFGTASSVAPGTSIVEVRANGDVYCLTRDAGGGCGWNFSYYAEQ